MSYTFYYRNYLKSCNYNCGYCPFPKEIAKEKMIARDREYLYKLVHFIESSNQKYNLFFSPKGEVLIYDYYQQALIHLSKLENIGEIIIQTNLSCNLEWLAHVNSSKLILWTTYHPSQVDSRSFFNQIKKLHSYQVKFTVGVVGVKGNFGKIKEMNSLLDELGEKKPYMWINAYKDKKDYYHSEDIQYLTKYDSLFEINLKDYKCKNVECETGQNVFFMEYNGHIFRCWQNKFKIGNLYTDDLNSIQILNHCEKNICSCFIGYSHIKSLNLNEVYKNSLLGRIP